MDAAARALPEPPLLRDGRDLLLRRHRPQDAEDVVEQCQDPDVVRSTTVPVPYTRADADGFLEHVAAGWADGTVASFAIEVGDRFAGNIDLRLQEGAWAEVGFGLAARARRRGVMTRALALVLEWGFTKASLRVAQRCGSVLEGSVRGLLLHRGQRLDGWIGTVLATDRSTT